MSITKKILVQGIKLKDGIIIPIWDDRITIVKTDMYGTVIEVNYNGNIQQIFSTIECIYNIKTKKIELGVELNYYPTNTELLYHENDKILYEKSHHILVEDTIKKIVYEEYVLDIINGKKIDKWWISKFKDVVIDENTIYNIKTWKPFYLLNSGIKIKHEYELFKIE